MTVQSYTQVAWADLASLPTVLVERQLFVVSWMIFLDEKATAISVCWLVVLCDSLRDAVMAAANNSKF